MIPAAAPVLGGLGLIGVLYAAAEWLSPPPCDTEGCANVATKKFGPMQLPDRDGGGEFVETGEGVAYDDDGIAFDVPAEDADEYDKWFPVTEWTGEYKTVTIYECDACAEPEENENE